MKPYKIGDQCPVCKVGTLLEPETNQVDDSNQLIYMRCSECSAIIRCYEPMIHQLAFHADMHKIKAFFGGFGSGKTRTGAEEMVTHVLSTPGGMTLIGAATKPQLDQTAKDMFFKVFPDVFIKEYMKQKDTLVCKNGHQVIFRPLDNEGKLRSLNLTAFWIEEASEVRYSIYVQLQTRLRNNMTKHHLGILTSNPDMNWIKSEVLLKADKIHNAGQEYIQIPEDINPNVAVHVAPTKLNTHLPKNYERDQAVGKPEWWVNRFLKGSFDHAEGLVYPQAPKYFVDSFDIPKNWFKCVAMDFGLRDPTVMLAAAIDPKSGIVYFYKEHYEANKSIKYHARQMHEKILDEIPNGRLQFLVADPKGKTKSEKDNRSTYDYYAEYDIYCRPAMNKIEDGIMKAFTYLENEKVRIFKSCVHLVKEFLEYKYPKQSLYSDKNASEKPIDKNNHAMDCLRYILAELPDDPNQILNMSFGSSYVIEIQDKNLPFALQSDQGNIYQSWEDIY